MRRALAIVLVAAALATDAAAGLRTDDPREVAAAIAAIERAPADADALFEAAKACEDVLADPARALRLYERIVAEQPDARVASSAERRIAALRVQVGTAGEHAREAGEMARLVAEAERVNPDDVVRRADALAAEPWPGAPETALWLADWLRRHERYAEAAARYDATLARWPGTPYANIALRDGAGTALETRDWSRAEALARRLPSGDGADEVVREDLLDRAARGRRRERWVVVAWIAVAVVLAGLVASLVEAARGARRVRWLPIEVVYLGPIAAVLVGVAVTAHRLIAPAVATIVTGGLVLAWLSGAALETLRERGRPLRRRALLHVAACAVAVVALGYIAVMREGLLDMLLETARFGPE